MTRLSFLWIGLAAGFAVTCFAQTQTSAAPAAPPPATVPPLKIGNVTVTASIRSRVEDWHWFEPDSGDNQYVFSGNIARVGFSQNRERWDWNAEFAVPFILGLPANAIAPGTQGALGMGGNYLAANDRNQNTAMLFPKQLFLSFKRFGGIQGSTLKLGRFEFLDGSEMAPKNAALAAVKASRVNQRLLGHFGFTHVGRSFDGMHYSFNRPSGNFTFVGAMPTRGVFQTDGWGWNKTAFGYASYTAPWGTGAHSAETRFLALYYDDWRQVLKTDSRALAVRRGDTGNIKVATFGGHSLHAFSSKAGTTDVLLWGTAQTGSWGVQDHRAYAIDVEAGFQPKILSKLKPWLRGGFYQGSGDSDPNDNSHGTFFQVLPTPRPFAKMPFFNMMNNRDIFGILILRPHSKVTVTSEFHSLRTTEKNDLWYQGGGVFQPWSFGYVGRPTNGSGSLANLYDIGADFRVNPRLTLSPYFGYAQGLAAISAIYPKGTAGAYGYMEFQYRF